MSRQTVPKTVDVWIESLAFGGGGVGRGPDGRVVFIPGTVPGDHVAAALVAERKSFARAHLVKLLKASPSRVAPLCPLFRDADCGGCQWQHVAIETQRASKQAILRRALRHVTAEVADLSAPVPPWGWRRRARLGKMGRIIGYRCRGSHRLIDVIRCPQMETSLEAGLAEVRSLALESASELCILASCRGDRHWVMGADRSGEPIDLGDDAAPFWAAANVFVQASAAGNELLRHLVRRAAARLPGRSRVLELYAGSGNFTRDLAVGAEVTAVEESPTAGALAQRNLALRGLSGRVTWVADSVVNAMRSLKDRSFQLIVANPPRPGMEPGVPQAIAELGSARIIVISCDPNTLARDVALMKGYQCVSAQPVDLMPQTFHVETVAVLDRSE